MESTAQYWKPAWEALERYSHAGSLQPTPRRFFGAVIVRSEFVAKAKTWVPPLRLFPIAAFCRLAKSLSHSQQMGWLVGTVGIEPKAALKTCKLLIRINAKNAKYTGIAQLRYTRGTRGRGE